MEIEILITNNNGFDKLVIELEKIINKFSYDLFEI